MLVYIVQIEFYVSIKHNLELPYIKNDSAFVESFLFSAPVCYPELVYPEHSRREGSNRWLKQCTLTKAEGKLIAFGKALHSACPDNGGKLIEVCHPELVYPEQSRREGRKTDSKR